MQDRFKYTDRMVIIFVILGFMLLIAFSALVLIKNKTLVNRVFYQTILDNASGLSSQPPIYFKGFEIGRIDDFELDSETNNIRVKFYIYENYSDKIIRYAVISRIENLLLGTSNQYEILLPRQDLIAQLEPLQEGELVPYINSELGQDYAKKGQIAVKFNGLDSVITSVNKVLINLQKESNQDTGEIFTVLNKISEIAESLLVITRQLEDDQLIPEVKKTITAIKSVIDTANSTVANAEKMVANANSFFSNAGEVAKHADTLLDHSISTVVEAEETIVKANAFFENAGELATHADKVLEGYENPSEIIARVTENKIPRMIDNVDVNLLYLQGILKEVHLQREQLAIAITSLNKTLSSFDKTLQGVNNNPLFRGGIEPEEKADSRIEVNEN